MPYGNLDSKKEYGINEAGSPYELTNPDWASTDMYIVSNVESLSDGEKVESIRSRKLVTVNPLNFKAVKEIERTKYPYKEKRVVKIHDSRKYLASMEKKAAKETPAEVKEN